MGGVSGSETIYPCPVCGAGADLVRGCPRCGRGPDPIAAEVIRLNAEIAGLVGRVEQARQTYLGLTATLRQRQQRRAELAARVQAMVLAERTRVGARPTDTGPAAPAPVAGGVSAPHHPPAAGAAAPAPVRPEASTRTVQNLLFILGGLLLGTAAVVFTAVAWATVGVAGRALILAGLTTLALAAPLLARRRGLTATAETFAAIGLLLVVLDGYAGWAVDLFGVHDWPRARYAALVGGASAAVAAGYRRLTRLAAPWYAGVLLLQTVPPLLAIDAGFGAAGWSLVLAGLAAANLTMPRGRGGDGPAGRGERARRTVAWLAYGLALSASAGCGTLALLVTDGPLDVLSGGPLLVGAVLLVAGALRAGGTGPVAVAGGVLVAVLGLALVRAAVESPWAPLFCCAVALALLACAVALGSGDRTGLARLARPRWLARLCQPAVRRGGRIGALLASGALAAVAVLMSLVVGLASVLRSMPPWRAAVDPPRTGPFDWQLPAALVLAVVALAVVLPRRGWRPTVLTGAVVVVLAAPAAVPLPWWAVAALGLATAAVLALGAVWPGRTGWAALPLAGGAGLLAGHGLLVGLARPAGAATVLGGLVLIGAAVAVTAPRPGHPAAGEDGPTGRSGPAGSVEPVPDHRRVLGGLGLAVAVLALPATGAAGLFAAGAAPHWRARAVLAVAVLLGAGLWPLRRVAPRYLPYAGAALSALAVAVGLAPALPGVGEPPGMYAAGALLLSVAVLLLVRRGAVGPDASDGAAPGNPLPLAGPPVAAAVVLTVRAAVAVAPDVGAVLGAPYAWLGRIWSGPPAGVGLSPGDGRPDGRAAIALSLLAVAAAVVARARRRSGADDPDPGRARTATLLPAVPVAAGAVLVGLAAIGARWPVVPALTLGVGLAGLLAAALTRTVGRVAWAALPLGVLFGAAGLVGLLPTRAGTLGGLAALLGAGIVVGTVAPAPAARVAGWLTGVGAAVALAVAGPLAAGLPVRLAGLAVLAVAALALAGGTVLRGLGRPGLGGSIRAVESTAVQAAGHLAAAVALALTVGAIRHAAAVCTLWGVALGLRALRPAEPAGHRWAYGAAAGGVELAGAWLLLASARVALVEAYTLPAAVGALLVGWLALRVWPALSSWVAYGPGLGAALLPSLVSVLVAGDQPARRLLLGAGALLAVLAGARWRRQAPVLIGGGALVVLAGWEVAAVWDLLPRWIFLAGGGFLLIGLATTYERRRRDVRRLRSVVSRMR